jgi:hypothetical protein
MFSLSTYRLGDLVVINNLNGHEQTELLKDYPGSVGSEYILALRANPNVDKMELITTIAMKHVDKHLSAIPADISQSTLLHLRLGDVVAGYAQHEMGKRPLKIDELKNMINQANESRESVNKLYVIGKCHFSSCSSHNYDECVKLSNAYLEKVLTDLNAEHFDSGNADIDLCCALKAKVFIQGRGFFSKLIVEIRKRLNLPVVETTISS